MAAPLVAAAGALAVLFAVALQGSYIVGPSVIFPSSGTPSFVQSAQGVLTGSATTLNVNFGALPGIANVIVVGAITIVSSAAGNTTVVTDNQGNTYSRLRVQPNDNGAEASRVSLWCAPVVASTGTFTVTSTVSTASNQGLLLLEYKHGTCNLDKSSSATGATSPYSCGSITTSNAHDLIVALLGFSFGGGGTNTYTAPTGFTARESLTDGTKIPYGSIADDIVSATGTFNSSYTANQNVNPGNCMQAALLSSN